MRSLALALAAAVLLAACGEQTTDIPRDGSDQPRYEATTTVLEDADGPRLCMGVILNSLPPQCEGVPVRGWSWRSVHGEDSQAGVTWGEFHVIGFYDGSTFDLIEAGPPRPHVEEDPQFEPPCAEPEGGWNNLDPSMTGRDDLTALMRTAEGIPAYAGVWIDYLQEPIDYEAPGEYVVTVAFTGDPAVHEAAIREVWGGPLCLTSAEHTYAELRRAQRDLGNGGADRLGLQMTWSDIDIMDNQVELGAVVSDPSLQSALDEAYGVGVVRVEPALRAI